MNLTTFLVIAALNLVLVFSPQSGRASDVVGVEGENIRQLVSDWVNAWRNGNFKAYTAHYVNDYTGDFSSHAAWRDQRRNRIAGRNDIVVELGSVLLRFNTDDPNQAQAIFVQTYRSKNWCDIVEKTLDLQRSKQGWRISKEQSKLRARC